MHLALEEELLKRAPDRSLPQYFYPSHPLLRVPPPPRQAVVKCRTPHAKNIGREGILRHAAGAQALWLHLGRRVHAALAVVAAAAVVVVVVAVGVGVVAYIGK